MSFILERIRKELISGNRVERSGKSRRWIAQKVKQLRVNRIHLSNDPSRMVDRHYLGKMYFFIYDAKTKAKLPYWDRFPLVFPIERYRDGFLGINLHYLDVRNRIALLDRLADIATNKLYNDNMRLKVRYQTIIQFSTLLAARPCIKRYLFSHIRSQFTEIKPNEWDIAATLPVEHFEKASKYKVWRDSRIAIGKKN